MYERNLSCPKLQPPISPRIVRLMLNHKNTSGVTSDFQELLTEQTEKIFSMPFFTALSEGLTPEEWPLYAKQFHVTCNSFDRLLNATVENARKTNYIALIVELKDNLADEMGENAPQNIPHIVLRRKFFQAIGLPEFEMIQEPGQIPILPGTQEHTAKVDQVIDSRCIYTQIGAFLAQEFLACGPGFQILASGVTKSFPELADRQNEAMKYVYGHVECDAMEHFPHLLGVTEPLMVRPDMKQKIFAGATTMLNTEWSLYDSLERDLLGNGRLG
jgi:hypothetical protein